MPRARWRLTRRRQRSNFKLTQCAAAVSQKHLSAARTVAERLRIGAALAASLSGRRQSAQTTYRTVRIFEGFPARLAGLFSWSKRCRVALPPACLRCRAMPVRQSGNRVDTPSPACSACTPDCSQSALQRARANTSRARRCHQLIGKLADDRRLLAERVETRLRAPGSGRRVLRIGLGKLPARY